MRNSLTYGKSSGNSGVRSVLEMINAITANGCRKECSRLFLLESMDEWALDLNINRMVKDNLVEVIFVDQGLGYRIPEEVFKNLYRSV